MTLDNFGIDFGIDLEKTWKKLGKDFLKKILFKKAKKMTSIIGE